MTSERARLMQEMHDGIGSNLTAALAVARQQAHPPKTIAVLKRALGDLKLTVDFLEPIEGDVVVLIGNLRHRMARDEQEPVFWNVSRFSSKFVSRRLKRTGKRSTLGWFAPVLKVICNMPHPVWTGLKTMGKQAS